WGSGKTFFMRKMMDRVNELAQAARDSGRKQKEIAFYKNIVQIEFNAWHYVEGNLWASLVEHIFSNLRLAGTGAADDPDGMSRLRTKLFDDLQIAEEIKRAAAARVAELESARDKAKARHQKVKEAHDDQARELAAVSARDIWAEIQHIPLNEEQKARLRDLGVGEQVMSSARELHESLEQLRAAGGRVRAHAAYFLNVLRQPKQFWLIAAGLVGVLLLGVGMTWFMRELGLREAGGAVSLSAQAIALVTGALAWLRG
ncbi:MAG TPA: hypothetical protein DCY13_02255, partial [Verrucomicrobiales bacterium]|nr:hypothetical protein [Verrucomicrobiales bacterium]